MHHHIFCVMFLWRLFSKTYPRCVETGSLWQSWSSLRTSERDDYGNVLKAIWDDLGNWEQVGSVLLSGSATPLRPAALWHDIIWRKLSPLMKWRGGEGSINSWSQKMVDSDICQEPDKQVHTHTHTHKYKDKNNINGRTARYTVCQSKWSISATLSQHWHNPKSTWLKLDLSNFAQTISVTSESFSGDWRHSVTLVTVTASHWQVCVLVHKAIHSPTIKNTHMHCRNKLWFFFCKQWMLTVILVLN